MPSETNLRIVSFDGGGIRGFSQLEIMSEIMHRLNFDNESNESDGGKLPCEYFDLMGGSGTGGLIAIMLAKLRMSVEEASEEFCTIVEQVYNPHGLSPSERTGKLRGCMEDIMKKKWLPLDLRLTEKTRPGACSAFVVVSPRTSAKSTLCLRTYPIRSQRSSTISVVEAVLATCATQPEFMPVSSGSGFKLREYIAASGAANPIYEVIAEAHELFGGESSVASLLSVGAGHPGIIALPPSGGEAGLHRIMRDMMDDREQRAQEIERRIGQAGVYSRFSVEQGMQNDQPGGPVDVAWIASQTENYLSQRDTRQKLDQFEQIFNAQSGLITLDQLEHAGGSAASGQLAASVERSLGILISNQDDVIIEKLKPADLECGPHAGECMEGTRQAILARIDAWAADVEAPNILWLNGHPGVGKSAIASSLVEKWRSSGRLGSSFFFRRERANVMTPNALWRTVAYDLGRQYPTIRKHLVAALNANESLPSTSNADALFRQLIHETLTKSGAMDCESLPVVVVDAVDECGGVDGWHSDHRKALMRTLKSWVSLPGRFKLVVTSRDELDIGRLFSTIAHHPLAVSAGQKVDHLSSMDIRKFLKHELQQIANYRELPSDWPGDQIIERLTDRAAGLFIWVKTVIKLLERGEPVRTLKQILEGGGAGGMAALYAWILNVSFPNSSHEDIRDFRSILGAIIFTKAPLGPTSLAQLLSIEGSTMGYICNGLQSVIDSGNVLQIHHQSFVDFLLDPNQCPQRFLIIRERESRNLSVACLKIMNSQLRFNICGLESSYLRYSDVPELQSRIEKHIPRHLFYSSRFWADHLAQTTFDTELFEHVRYFTQNQFLFWLEVLSLTSKVNVASSMLWALLNWIRASHQDDSLAADMQKFVAAFASVISQSVSHIYLSALPFSPRGLGVSEQYLARYPHTIDIQRGGQTRWPTIQNVLSGHTGGVHSVALSPDGRLIVSGSDDQSVRVWDAETGETVLGPLEGHINCVNSVSFSPDGRRIVSGSSDWSIRVWDAETGETVIGPFEGHTGWVNSVSFSPDGRLIVSGSSDQSVRLWDAETGRMMLEPLEGHIDHVKSVAFSPDGRQIVSGSGDCSVRVWDAETGQTVLGPLYGHPDRVNSVAFSPDGQHIVSGSDDQSVRVWDAKVGQTVLGPLEGHIGHVKSVAFSPDGRHIVSGSSDQSVRVWDAETGETVLGPLEGHTFQVSSVSFTPDGRRIVSGSKDQSIRVWDTEIGQTALPPLEGHIGHVKSVAFSSDGRRIVSGSSDWSIRVWDAETGETVIGPFEGHTDCVNSVSFSPDGRRIVSGSNDRSVRIWDAETGQPVLEPLKGHTHSVNSVSFSPDGRRIVSGSNDRSVRVWDVATGQTALGPLKVHNNGAYHLSFLHRINAVSFSPDGQHIISASNGGSVLVRDAETGRIVLRPLEREFYQINCVSFSPDGLHIVSGSSRQLSLVWKVEIGLTVIGPLKRHNYYVNSASFPPNGRRIASGPSCRSIRARDAEMGETVLEGHTNRVNSALFSPDGRCVASGSSDRSIRVWDAETGRTVLRPLKGHTRSVNSISFSSDGRRIVSGSSDGSIRVWNVDVSETLATPIVRNSSVVTTSFSSDGGHIADDPRDITVPGKNVKEIQSDGHVYSIFQNNPSTKDGWVLGPNSELLFWVPPEIRPRLCALRNTLVIGGEATHLDLKHFVHGEAWNRCNVPI